MIFFCPHAPKISSVQHFHVENLSRLTFTPPPEVLPELTEESSPTRCSVRSAPASAELPRRSSVHCPCVETTRDATCIRPQANSAEIHYLCGDNTLAPGECAEHTEPTWLLISVPQCDCVLRTSLHFSFYVHLHQEHPSTHVLKQRMTRQCSWIGQSRTLVC